MPKGLVVGVGINDAGYTVCRRVSGVRVTCPYYRIWGAMLRRGYSEQWKLMHPTYKDVHVCKEWHTFSVFKAWMETQDWEGKQLDKDLLVPGNKVYSPETCVFVSPMANSFLNKQEASRGELPIGVHLDRKSGKYLAQCRDYRDAKRNYLGLYETPQEAHEVWLKRKKELAAEPASVQDDQRIAKIILETRYEEW